jgi:hypothetical protein
LWYSSAGQKLLRIIVVHDPAHRRRDDCFFSTDRELTPPEILTNFLCAGLWKFAFAT